jgi:hypothetical protein
MNKIRFSMSFFCMLNSICCFPFVCYGYYDVLYASFFLSICFKFVYVESL